MTTQARVDNAALFAVLSSLADNKQTIGRRYAYWCNGAPTLESAVAAAAMTQAELGHARTLYPLLEDFVQADPVQVEPMTRTLHYHLAALDQDFTGWCDFVAANFLVDTALTTFFEAAQDSSYEPLRTRSRKIVQEEDLHRVHAEGWVRRLSGVGGAVRQALIASLDHFWDETLCWYGPPDDVTMQRLCHEGSIDADPDQLRGRFLQKIMPVLERAGIERAATFATGMQQWECMSPLSWSHWDGTARRRESAE
jgi:ring-1,2-phenylacetyl-CoA epoxidase subunit PaaC